MCCKILLGLICIVLSFLYFFRPKAINQIGKVAHKIISESGQLFAIRILVGFFYIVAGLMFVYVSFY